MMSDITRHDASTEINTIFASLNPTDVEQFYQSYQLWTLQQQIAALQTQVATVQQQIAENNEQMQQVQPHLTNLSLQIRLPPMLMKHLTKQQKKYCLRNS